MYHQHFGLSGPPFRFTPTPDALYLGKTHREALAALEWGLLREPTGFTVLVGESGVGKTTLVCSLLAHRYESVRAAFITNPKLNFEQLLQVALSQLAPGVHGRDKFELTETFIRQLDELAPGQRIALILDESQELGDETLEELRLLSNFDAGSEHRLQLIFVGQAELIERLGSARMRSLNQRIGARALLNPLSPAEMREYIDCRLRAKGGKTRNIFASEALKYLMAHSRGIPRRINVLCHNAMLLGYAAGSKRVTLAMARNTVNDYEDLLGTGLTRVETLAPTGGAARSRRWMRRPAIAVSTLALAAVAAIYLWSAHTLSTSSPSLSDVAIRSAAGSKTTGPGILPRPVAKAGRGSDAGVMDLTGSELHKLDLLAAGKVSHAGAGVRTRESKIVKSASSSDSRAALPAKAPDPAAPRSSQGGAAESAPDASANGGAAKSAGEAQTSKNTDAVATSAGPRNIQVKDGDTLWKIAIRYLGSSDRFGELIHANPQLNNINQIYPGETVHLPPIPGVASR